ncbi:hypothetical protein ASG38_12500 [Flavobacterium sp. Leaf359]|uniref:DUF6843 domain-containing protein n=1 Tax=Flavobacterium sp. Leaf359 TaxID=1736351 RepID=UPI0006F4B76D|nr:hypothetical protein [Flavobacterium sp. Leaf359]KQS46602.1 hypothetical protein ASG38_12500 [Flavobacterium sp. Leaf359]
MSFKYIKLIGIIFLFISCNDVSEIYLIPKDYHGKVSILFNQEKGSPPQFENNTRVYKIPSNGILLTQFEDVYGYAQRKYYFVDSKGNRSPIKVLDNRNSNNSEVGIYNATNGVYGNSDAKNPLKFQEFYVSSKKNLDTYMTNDMENFIN